MAHSGSRTKATDVWLSREDEDRFGGEIKKILPKSAWMCSQPGPVGLHQVHLHLTIQRAMACGGVQAFLPLPAGASVPSAVEVEADVPMPIGPRVALVQLLRAKVLKDGRGDYFRSGRLAVQWFEPEVGPQMSRVLAEQTRFIWAALRAATYPATVIDYGGQRTGGMRVGPIARAMVLDTQMPLARSGLLRYRLVEAAAPRKMA